VGLLVIPVAGWVAVITLLTTFTAYLAHPTWPWWTVYLFEVTPVLALLVSLGVAAILRVVSGEWRTRRHPAPSLMPRAMMATLAGCVLVAPALLKTAAQTRLWYMTATRQRRDFESIVARLPHQPAIVFVHYGPNHSPHFGLTANTADWQHAPAWIVYDMGDKSTKLMKLAPQRYVYIFDEAKGRILSVQRPGIENGKAGGGGGAAGPGEGDE
jgi:hypothetical protein